MEEIFCNKGGIPISTNCSSSSNFNCSEVISVMDMGDEHGVNTITFF